MELEDKINYVPNACLFIYLFPCGFSATKRSIWGFFFGFFKFCMLCLKWFVFALELNCFVVVLLFVTGLNVSVYVGLRFVDQYYLKLLLLNCKDGYSDQYCEMGFDKCLLIIPYLHRKLCGIIVGTQ